MSYSILYYKWQGILISNEDFEHLSKIKWYINELDGNVYGKINNKEYILKNYIYEHILGKNLINVSIEYINNNKLDNRRDNLKEEDMNNMVIQTANYIKEKNRIRSEYCGVIYHETMNRWEVSIYNEEKTLNRLYKYDEEAGYQYDLWVDRYNLGFKKNGITLKSYRDIIKNNIELQNGIFKHVDNYKVYMELNKRNKNYCINMFDTFDLALKAKNMMEGVKERYLLVICEIKSRFNKEKNEDGNYIFVISKKEVIIDEDMYYNMYRYKWYMNNSNNVRCKKCLLSRMIMNCYDNSMMIEHINNNKLDYRRCNLRVISQKQYRMKYEIVLSKNARYIGVEYDDERKQWLSYININNRKKCLGYFDDEMQAAIRRDIATQKYFRELGRLNFDNRRPSWDMYFMNIAEVVKLRSCDFTKVGAVLVSMNDKRIISTGYNSLRSGMDDKVIDWTNRELIKDIVIHAEMNAIIYAQSKFEDAILYITLSPCKACLKIIASTKIKKVIYKNEYRDIKEVKDLAKLLNIELIEFKNDM